MSELLKNRMVQAVHGSKDLKSDPQFELEMAASFRHQYSHQDLMELYIDIPIIKTDLEIKAVKVETGADIGMNTVILPGVTIGKGSIIGAGAVVTKDVPPFAIVAGVPAQFLRWREGYKPLENTNNAK
ncbi:hypothetical protein IQ231_15870 [Cuspidothrix issatschenkoi LEGE 03284]|nr:hypothetical protein [Cuspidothrix issatschenkoi LEGE 03284]